MLWPTIKQQQKICQFLKLATATAVSSNSSTIPIKQTKANSFQYHSADMVEPRFEISWNCVYEQIIMTTLVTNTVWTRWLACTERSDRKWCSIWCNMQQIIVLTDQFAYKSVYIDQFVYINIYWSVGIHQFILHTHKFQDQIYSKTNKQSLRQI